MNIAGSIVSGNNGRQGGGLFNGGGVVKISESVVSGNLASTGGGLVNDDGAVTISLRFIRQQPGLWSVWARHPWPAQHGEHP